MDGSPALLVEVAGIDGVTRAVDWAAREGWNPGLDDAGCFLAADPGGFLQGSQDGRPVGTISAVRYGADFGFIGLYIVEPHLRGHGIGSLLWSAALDRLAGRVVGLDGVVAMQQSYARSGFVLAHRSIRFGGVADVPLAAVGATEPLDPRDLGDLVAYDRECFGAARPGFLARWIRQPDVIARVVRREGRLQGYGVLRRCRDGAKVGPLFADDADTASQLLDALLARSPREGPVYLDVPEPNEAGRALARRRGLLPVFETARMYRGGDPALPLARVFGITTFELG